MHRVDVADEAPQGWPSTAERVSPGAPFSAAKASHGSFTPTMQSRASMRWT
jgi:hypothetical protein